MARRVCGTASGFGSPCLLENDYIPGEDMCHMVVFSRSRADGVSRTFVPPCPSPSCGDRNVVVVAVQGAPILVFYHWFSVNVT